MARDESRHAGFINQWLQATSGIGVDLGFLKRARRSLHVLPAQVHLLCDLPVREDRLCALHRHLPADREATPTLCFHPIFRWFERWCNDEFRHGESFALIMRANPHLLRGGNVYWIRFFLLAVYATMYVRDHTRPQLNAAMGFDPTEYDYEVFRITTDISKQVFPVSLDTDNPVFRAGLDRLLDIQTRMDAAKARGGLIGRLQQAGLAVAGVATFARLYFLPVHHHDLPAQVRMAPAW
jgi:magnesium-protoporphyrin IX monomethyl ester (oxidative) cyclase